MFVNGACTPLPSSRAELIIRPRLPESIKRWVIHHAKRITLFSTFLLYRSQNVDVSSCVAAADAEAPLRATPPPDVRIMPRHPELRGDHEAAPPAGASPQNLLPTRSPQTTPRNLLPAGIESRTSEVSGTPSMLAGARPDPFPSDDDDSDADSDASDGPQENGASAEPEPGEEIDPATDPFADPGPLDLQTWERLARAVTPRRLTSVPVEVQRQKVKQVLGYLDQNPGDPSASETEALTQALENIELEIPKAEEFVAGGFANNRAAWEEMLAGDNSRTARRVKSWLKNGFKPTFAKPESAKPHKRRIVEGMLRKRFPDREPAEFLTGTRPHRVAFQNHRSFYQHWEFSSQELLKLLLWGAIAIAQPREEVVVVESPLGVVDQDGKCRLFLNARYVNLFLAELPFQYQRLRDVLVFTAEGSFMSTWDLKSGYYHIFLHPTFRKYMGFRVGSLVFRYNVPAFGLSQACFLFTKLMNQPAKALRSRRVPISDYIDDGVTAAATFARCLLQTVSSVRLLAALGAFLGIPKCKLTPEQVQKWLGFLLDSVRQRFLLSPSRLAKLKLQLTRILQADYVSARDLASLAGRIVSASPAVLPASLLSRPFFLALRGKVTWDALFHNQAAVKEAARFWLQNLDRFNGRPWWPSPVTIRTSVDASGVGYGGQIETYGKPPFQFRGTFSTEFASSSSAAREVAGYVAAVRSAFQVHPETLRGSSLLVTGDSQPAVSCINELRSPQPQIQELLRQLFDLCLEAECSVQARWVPREELPREDALSREPDASDWGLSPDLVYDIIQQFGVRPAVDLFASAVHHVTERFVSKYFEPGCTAVQALQLDWRTLAGHNDVLWAFPPPGFAGQVLAKLLVYRIDAILIIRELRESNEWIVLRSLPNASVSRPFKIPRLASSCIPSLRVPQQALNPAFLGLCAVYIHWF